MSNYTAQEGHWYSVEEYLPDSDWVEHFYNKHHTEPEFIVHVKGYPIPTVLRYTGEKWIDDSVKEYDIDYWQLLPTTLPKSAIIFSSYLNNIHPTKNFHFNSYSGCIVKIINNDKSEE